MSQDELTNLNHELLGECEFVRVEGVDWIIRAARTGTLYRVPPSQRREFVPSEGQKSSDSTCDPASESRIDEIPTDTPINVLGMKRLLWAIRAGNSAPRTDSTDASRKRASTAQRAPIRQPTNNDVGPHAVKDVQNSLIGRGSLPVTEAVGADELTGAPTPSLNVNAHDVVHADPRLLRRVFESLRNGLSPVQIELREFAVGIEPIRRRVTNLLADVTVDGGRAAVIRGTYGQGKTFCLQLLREMALEAGYVVASTEIDSAENKLDKPNYVYRSLMQHLRIPNGRPQGANGLAILTNELFRNEFASLKSNRERVMAARARLRTELQCEPLAWLLSDPNLPTKDLLISLLGGEPGIPIGMARKCHEWPGASRDWPSFTAGTQGDFASYVLAGLVLCQVLILG